MGWIVIQLILGLVLWTQLRILLDRHLHPLPHPHPILAACTAGGRALAPFQTAPSHMKTLRASGFKALHPSQERVLWYPPILRVLCALFAWRPRSP